MSRTETDTITMTSEITVTPIQQMGGDHMIVAAARVSTSGPEALQYADEARRDEGAGLINYLLKHRHGTPFEHAAMTFFCHAPIFVWREWHRHRVGFCLSGDTEIWSESYAKGSGRTLRKRKLKELSDIWNNGVRDVMGRTRFLPSIKQQKLRVLNEDTGFFELGRIHDIRKTGVKECLLVETEHKKGWSLRCSADHRILTSEGWVRAGDLSGAEMIAVSGKRSAFEHRQIPPALRTGIGVWTSMQRTALLPSSATCYVCGKPFQREDLVLDHVVPVAENLKLALDPDNLKPACETCHREKAGNEQVLAQRSNVAGVRYERLKQKPYIISEEMTYDIAMEPPWHNFVANGIVVHNSYNEESGRYKQLEPVFWIPRRQRPMMVPPKHKPARPVYLPLEDDAAYEALVERSRHVYQTAYDAYLADIEAGFAMEVARRNLPLAIYSSCWVTCNPRSLMHFLSLRTHDSEAAFISYPQAEIEEAARMLERIFATGWPLAYQAFVKNGRVGP